MHDHDMPGLWRDHVQASSSVMGRFGLLLFSLSSFLFLFTDNEDNINKHYSFSMLRKGLAAFSFSVILYTKVFGDLAKLHFCTNEIK